MDEQENIKRSEQSSSKKLSRYNNGRSESDSIPPDLIFEILSRLSTKSIVRCRSVCKLWSSITTTSEFINSFVSRPCPSVMLIFRKKDTLFVFSSPLHHQNSDDPISYVKSISFTNPNHGSLRPCNSVNGLICLEASTQLEIWSPTMERFLTLRVPKGKYKRGFLGYDPIHRKYKALCILEGKKVGILTLGGAQESWRIKPDGLPQHRPNATCGRCINGVVYYKAFLESHLKHAIVSFDVRSERLKLINFPRKYSFAYCCLLVSYEGRLALVDTTRPAELWVLEDAENHEWSYTHFPPYKDLQGQYIRFQVVTDAGEFSYVDIWNSEKWLYVDLKKNSVREIKTGTRCGNRNELELYFIKSD